jgi:hypothetical protein
MGGVFSRNFADVDEELPIYRCVPPVTSMDMNGQRIVTQTSRKTGNVMRLRSNGIMPLNKCNREVAKASSIRGHVVYVDLV